MALRVLLADESTTIKKVMQLALQDFAVEVKAVHVGVDVVEVARAFKPDIVFADVLLQKRNGYEVCGDLKQDPQIRAIPVVLMWSSFMELDENLASSSGADQRLEKPFDVEHLRRIVLELVPKTRSQRLAHFLQFPGSFAEPLKEEERQREGSAQTPPTPFAPAPPPPQAQPRQQVPTQQQQQPTQSKAETASNWNMDSFDDIQEFAAKPESPETRSSGSTRSHISSVNLRDASDEEFSEFKIAPLADRSNSQVNVSNSHPQDEALSLEDEHENSSADFVFDDKKTQPRVQAGDDEETWSHQDLSRFKVDLEPITLETEDEAFDPGRTVTQQSQRPSASQAAGQSGPQNAGPRHSSRHNPTSAPMKEPSLHSPADDEFGDLLEIEEVSMEPSGSDEPTEMFGEAASLELDPDFSGRDSGRDETVDEAPDFRHSNTNSGPRPKSIRASVPELSSDDLERIVRAQSRETIEALVRKIVPDLAARIIREELERLLEENP